MSAGFERSSTG